MFQIHRVPERSAPDRRAFSLVEVVVVIGILALLMGLLFPSLAAMRRAAAMTVELNAGKQMSVAYTAYAVANKDELMPGYKTGLRCRDQANRDIAALTIPAVAARYPWRLAPYLDFNFDGLYINDNQAALERMRAEDEATYLYTVSVGPSLGLNSYWVGGHQGQGLAFNETAIQNFGQFYVTRQSHVRRTEQLIVFASARANGIAQYNDGANVEGYFNITSPYFASASTQLWSDIFDDKEPSRLFGNVSLRHNNEAVSVAADGHVELLPEHKLRDMRRWANGADAEVWGLAD